MWEARAVQCDDSSSLALPPDKYVMRYARARVYMHTPSGTVSVCPRVQRGHANIVLKRNRASELHGGARGKAREASKSKSERVTVGDPAAGCRQHSYNTTRPARPTHRAQYTVHIPRHARAHAYSVNELHVQCRIARHRRPWELQPR